MERVPPILHKAGLPILFLSILLFANSFLSIVGANFLDNYRMQSFWEGFFFSGSVFTAVTGWRFHTSKRAPKPEILISEEGFETRNAFGRLSPSRWNKLGEVNLLWTELRKVEFRRGSIRYVFRSSGGSNIIPFYYIPYKERQEITEAFRYFGGKHGVEVS